MSIIARNFCNICNRPTGSRITCLVFNGYEIGIPQLAIRNTIVRNYQSVS